MFGRNAASKTCNLWTIAYFSLHPLWSGLHFFMGEKVFTVASCDGFAERSLVHVTTRQRDVAAGDSCTHVRLSASRSLCRSRCHCGARVCSTRLSGNYYYCVELLSKQLLPASRRVTAVYRPVIKRTDALRSRCGDFLTRKKTTVHCHWSLVLAVRIWIHWITRLEV